MAIDGIMALYKFCIIIIKHHKAY